MRVFLTRIQDIGKLRARISRRLTILIVLFVGGALLYFAGEIVNYLGWEGAPGELFFGVHDVHRLAFLPVILYAAYFYKMRGALLSTLAAFLVFLPRALFFSPYPNPLLRMLLFVLISGASGVVVALIRENADRRSRLEKLVELERDKLTGIIGRMEEGVMIIGPDYRIRFLNASMVREFGGGIGDYCYGYLNKLDSPCWQICKLPSVIRGAVERWDYSSPRGRTYEVIAAPYVDSDGVTCQLSTFRNITERKKVEAELVELNRLKTELVSHVSHELKSPLTSIKGIISSLLQKDINWDEETRLMLLTGISEETDRLTSLVNNLLNMSKLEAGVWQPQKERCAIADIVSDALEQQRWVHRKHLFKTDIPGDLRDVYVDYGQIRQVLINLMENAAAYSDEGSEITVGARGNDGLIEVTVADKGIGILPEDMGKLFEKFYRGSQERRSPGGTGLGLAICKALVQAHSGKIWAESVVGQGSTFHFTLPAAVDHA